MGRVPRDRRQLHELHELRRRRTFSGLVARQARHDKAEKAPRESGGLFCISSPPNSSFCFPLPLPLPRGGRGMFVFLSSIITSFASSKTLLIIVGHTCVWDNASPPPGERGERGRRDKTTNQQQSFLTPPTCVSSSITSGPEAGARSAVPRDTSPRFRRTFP